MGFQLFSGQSGILPVVGSQEELEKLTHRHTVKVLLQAGCSVEEVGYAVGEVVGFDSIKLASRMNSAVVIFLDEVHKVEQVVETGIVLRDTFTPVYPLVNPSKKITISNAGCGAEGHLIRACPEARRENAWGS